MTQGAPPVAALAASLLLALYTASRQKLAHTGAGVKNPPCPVEEGTRVKHHERAGKRFCAGLV